jgi:hypothetical protein
MNIAFDFELFGISLGGLTIRVDTDHTPDNNNPEAKGKVAERLQRAWMIHTLSKGHR